MSIPQIHPWTVHLASSHDEFAARCGANERGMLVAEEKPERWLLIGYRMCEKCEAKNSRGEP